MTWAKHLLAFTWPAFTTLYLVTGPHTPYGAVAWLVVPTLLVLLDRHAGPQRRQPDPDEPLWPYDVLLYALFAWHFANLGLFVRAVHAEGLLTMSTVMGIVFVGTNGGYSAIVVAHELVHRRSAWERNLGRLLMISVNYEHFA